MQRDKSHTNYFCKNMFYWKPWMGHLCVLKFPHNFFFFFLKSPWMNKFYSTFPIVFYRKNANTAKLYNVKNTIKPIHCRKFIHCNSFYFLILIIKTPVQKLWLKNKYFWRHMQQNSGWGIQPLVTGHGWNSPNGSSQGSIFILKKYGRYNM